jgi:hypothetical protein
MVTGPKGVGPDKDYTGEGQHHIQNTGQSSRQRGRLTKKKDRKYERVTNIWSWAKDGARHLDL